MHATKKEIRARKTAVQSVQLITKSMEMIAAAKLKRVKNRMEASQPYVKSLISMIQRLIETDLHYTPTYLVARPVQKVVILVAGSDLGLCGGLNLQLFRKVLALIEEFQEQKIEVSLVLLGEKAVSFFSKYPFEILGHKTGFGTVPSFRELIGLCRLITRAFENGSVDALYTAYNQFVSSTIQVPQLQPLLPLSLFVGQVLNAPQSDGEEKKCDYLYESDPKKLLDSLLLRILESLIYQNVLENFSCVQAARMCAMQNASSSAKDLLDELKREQDKLRQAGITQELMEIVSGSGVVSD